MSIFDKDLIENEDRYQQIISDEEGIALSLAQGGCVVETNDTEAFIDKIYKKLSMDYTVLGNGPLADRLKSQQGRPIIHWDVTSFRKDIAIRSMYSLCRLPKDPKPIIIIENITDIPDGDRSLYDDPVLVESILLHSWKNDVIYLTHPQNGSFQLNRRDFSVIFPVKPGGISKLRHRPDGIAVIQL